MSKSRQRKVKAANGLYRDFTIPILETLTAIYKSPVDVANLIGQTFSSVSSSDSYSPAFQAIKNRLERTPISFRCRQPLPYNCDFDLWELKRVLLSAHNTSPGPNRISYELLHRLNEDSLTCLLNLFNRIWRKQMYPTRLHEAIVIPILKPGKDPKNPLSYQPIALRSYLCKTLEPMVKAHLVYQLEKNRCIPLWQSGFCKGRSTLDNNIMLEIKPLQLAIGQLIENNIHGYWFDTSCGVFTAEAVAIYRALQLINPNMSLKFCIYTDSMSVLEALESYNDRCHPVVCNILDISSPLCGKGFDIAFCWSPSHVGIIGNEQAASAAWSATTLLPLAIPLSDLKRVILNRIFTTWQESWSQQLDNKLRSVKPVIGAWPVMPMQRVDVKLTRFRIGHTRFSHRHLLLKNAPECPSCKVSYSV
ncbi:RNase H domain-containing protein [Trichonephila clavipes]|nr:RNase H domain-containing protein [Trichonephila clavipes]